MKRIVLILLAVVAVGCENEKGHVEKSAETPQSKFYLKSFKGHDYVVLESTISSYAGPQLLHSPDCKCGRGGR